jgi:NADH-quinone oxidoreductase subunit N
MTQLPYLQLLHLSVPQIVLDITALIVLFSDLALRQKALRFRFAVASGIASAGCAIAIVRLLTAQTSVNLFDGMLVANLLISRVQIALLVLTIFTLLLSIDSTFTDHIGEFVTLILLAVTGMMFLVSTQNILVTFISLELLSLALYSLTAFDKRRPQSSEAALKYFLFGGMSAAFLLFGFTLLYGISNSTNFGQIGAAIAITGMTPIVVIAIVTSIIGFGFKVAAAPFHFWAPDVYQGAPNPVAAFIASSSKVASFFVFFTLMSVCYSSVAGSAEWMHFTAGWAPVLAAVAALSMIVGNLGALAQSSLRRLLAYSAIAHTGYMLIAIVARTPQTLGALLYYVVTYSLSVLGTFAIIAIVEQQNDSPAGKPDQLENFNGLSRRAPILSACLFVFLLSQAGIPPLAGFFGKFYLFASALHAPAGYSALLWLVILALAMSAVSLFYYLQILKRVYVTDPTEITGPLRTPSLAITLIALLAFLVLGLGCFPETLIRWFSVFAN